MPSDEAVKQLKLEIAESFRRQLRIELDNADRYLSQMESFEYRQTMARTDPEGSKYFESHTREEREKRGYDLALSAAIGHAIVFGFGLLQSYSLGS